MRTTLFGLFVLVACVHPTPAGSAPMQNDKALALLGSPDTWCRGADQLAKSGDAAMIVPILHAYESREETGKVCLLEAMEALGAKEASHALFDGPGPDDRRMAVHLMGLFVDDSHLPWLEQAAVSTDDRLRREAIRAVATQIQTEAWEASMIRLLAVEPRDTRAQAIQSLSRRRTESAYAALAARIGVEPDPELERRIAAVVSP